MKILVTGGAGFIGSHVVDGLIAAGHEPRIFDVRRSKYHAAGEVEHLLGDLNDGEALRAALAGCDAIAHLAAVADVNIVVANPVEANRVNVDGTFALLEAMRALGVGRLLYASTVWVYGGASEEDVDEDTPIALPDHVYTATKLAGEAYCHSFSHLYGIEQTILRFGIPYGPRGREATVVPAFVARARAGRAITIAGDGRQSRQFVYVGDLADGVVAALKSAAAGRVYNLVGETSTTVREIADTVREIVGDVPIVHTPERPADLRIGHVSGVRAAAELGWHATTPFVDGVRRYVDWVAETSGSPVARAASSTDGSAATVRRQESAEL